MEEQHDYFLIIKGDWTVSGTEDLIFDRLDDPYPADRGISINKIAWLTDWTYTRATINNNGLSPLELETRLNRWLTKHTTAPFPDGSLLWWNRND